MHKLFVLLAFIFPAADFKSGIEKSSLQKVQSDVDKVTIYRTNIRIETFVATEDPCSMNIAMAHGFKVLKNGKLHSHNREDKSGLVSQAPFKRKFDSVAIVFRFSRPLDMA